MSLGNRQEFSNVTKGVTYAAQDNTTCIPVFEITQ